MADKEPSAIEFAQWLNQVTANLSDAPARRIREELTAHYEGLVEDLREQGMEPAQADAQALAVMGDPATTASKMDKLYLTKSEEYFLQSYLACGRWSQLLADILTVGCAFGFVIGLLIYCNFPIPRYFYHTMAWLWAAALLSDLFHFIFKRRIKTHSETNGYMRMYRHLYWFVAFNWLSVLLLTIPFVLLLNSIILPLDKFAALLIAYLVLIVFNANRLFQKTKSFFCLRRKIEHYQELATSR